LNPEDHLKCFNPAHAKEDIIEGLEKFKKVHTFEDDYGRIKAYAFAISQIQKIEGEIKSIN
jgi:cell fate (sporulation/competence/biofilm development) regulator YmcA (YheA/YmcA/DUF963 family)